MVTNVVMMGMGEPLLNFDNVVAAMDLMMEDLAYGISKRRVTLSTSGVVPALDRLAEVSECIAGGVAARAQRRPARPAGAHQPQIPYRDVAGERPQLHRRPE